MPLLELDVEAGVPQVGDRQLEWLGMWLRFQAASCSRRYLLPCCWAGRRRQRCRSEEQRHSRLLCASLPCCPNCFLDARPCTAWLDMRVWLGQRGLWLLLLLAAAPALKGGC